MAQVVVEVAVPAEATSEVVVEVVAEVVVEVVVEVVAAVPATPNPKSAWHLRSLIGSRASIVTWNIRYTAIGPGPNPKRA